MPLCTGETEARQVMCQGHVTDDNICSTPILRLPARGPPQAAGTGKLPKTFRNKRSSTHKSDNILEFPQMLNHNKTLITSVTWWWLPWVPNMFFFNNIKLDSRQLSNQSLSLWLQAESYDFWVLQDNQFCCPGSFDLTFQLEIPRAT